MGRPNVGKSTLFNRLIGRRQAIVSSTRGTTRDRLYGTLEWRGIPLTLIDAGGVELTRPEGLGAAIQRHVQEALREADGVVLICDAQDGLLPADALILDRLRRLNKPLLLAVNKLDDRPNVPAEFFSLGLHELFPLSALHGRGTGELLDRLVQQTAAPATPATHEPEISDLSVAIVGRQNVGKSSLLNALLRQERVIVSELPGTTRDTVDTELKLGGTRIRLIDTAGLRHRRKVKDPIDFYAMSRTTDAVRRCDVALVVLDATAGITRDDQRMLRHVAEAGCGCVIAVNKWDLITGGRRQQLPDAVHRQAASVPYAPVLAVSAKTGFQVADSLQLALRVARAMRRGLEDAQGLTWLQRAWQSHPPPRWRGRVIRLHDVEWLPGRPNHLRLTLRPVGWLPKPYQQYVLKQLYRHPQLSGIPIQLKLKASCS